MSSVENARKAADRHYGALMGTVVDNADPEGLHRVTVKIEGIADPATDWAWPLTAGGGSKARGGHIVPDIGADVVVWFHQGDPQGEAFYACGWWGVPKAGTEVPDDLQSDKSNAHLIQTYQLGPLSFTVDERPDSPKFVISHATAGDFILWDLKTMGIQFRFTAAFLVKVLGRLELDATDMVLKGRKVLPDSKAI